MEYCPGRVFTDPNLPDCSPADRQAIYGEVARVLAQIHSVDMKAVRLDDFGPGGSHNLRYFKKVQTKAILVLP
jgi:aminoglycoside phosphotransferase (APT) family kinase protein